MRLNELESVGAILKGHFLLTSGRHSEGFFLLSRLTQHPGLLEKWIEELVSMVKSEEWFKDVSVIAGPAMGGILPAYELARQLGLRLIFLEKDQGMKLKRGMQLEPEEGVLVIEDAVTTGGSVLSVVKEIEALGGRTLAILALVDRSGGKLDFPVPFFSVLRVEMPSYTPKECPLCLTGQELVKPKL